MAFHLFGFLGLGFLGCPCVDVKEPDPSSDWLVWASSDWLYGVSGGGVDKRGDRLSVEGVDG